MTDTTETNERKPLTAEERAEWLEAMDFLDGCDGCEFTMPESLLRRLGRRALADLERKDQQIAWLKRLLAESAIPLEALYRTEMDGTALCDSVKQAVASSVEGIREALRHDG